MTASTVVALRQPAALRAWLPAFALVGGLGVIVAARWWATRAGLDPLAVGAAFGVGLLALAAVGGWSRTTGRDGAASPRPAASGRAAATALAGATLRAVGLGLLVGLGLVAITLVASALRPAFGGASPVLGLGRPAAPFLPWAAITLVVATAEEILLRGLLFDRVVAASRARGNSGKGIVAAVVVTSTVFALMHVPVYGWHVVPLDLAVGCCLAGLRLLTGGIAAPAAAHAVADLATWWL
jgi:membrane protease YdiL (CAAX protease family)